MRMYCVMPRGLAASWLRSIVLAADTCCRGCRVSVTSSLTLSRVPFCTRAAVLLAGKPSTQVFCPPAARGA